LTLCQVDYDPACVALSRPTGKRQAIEASVLRATEELLGAGSSYADLNVERIATAAGISRTAFYFYFRDKRELLMRLTAEVNQQLYAEAERWFTGDAAPAETMARIAALYDEHGALLRAIVEVSTYDEEIATFWRGLLRRFIDATTERVGSEATAFALVWMTERAFYQQLVQEQPLDPGELVQSLAGIWEQAATSSPR
jgi:AcrR family transcriptional regulator